MCTAWEIWRQIREELPDSAWLQAELERLKKEAEENERKRSEMRKAEMEKLASTKAFLEAKLAVAQYHFSESQVQDLQRRSVPVEDTNTAVQELLRLSSVCVTREDWAKMVLVCCSGLKSLEVRVENAVQKALPGPEHARLALAAASGGQYAAFWRRFWDAFCPAWEAENRMRPAAERLSGEPPEKEGGRLCLWQFPVELPLEGLEAERLSNAFPGGIRDTRTLLIPALIDPADGFTGAVYSPIPEPKPLIGFILRLLLQILLLQRVEESRVVLIDNVTCNPKTWAPFDVLGSEHGFIFFPGDENAQLSALNNLEKLNPRNGRERNSPRWVIVYGEPSGQEVCEKLNMLIHNSETDRVNILLCREAGAKNTGRLSGLRYNLELQGARLLVSDFGSVAEAAELLPPLPAGNIPWEALREAYKGAYRAPSDLFFERVGFPENLPDRLPPKERFGQLSIPFALDKASGELFDLTFSRHTAFAYLAAPTQSGKTTALHMMISWLVTHRHPDDVELWLLDLKGSDFRLYERGCPPHIRYILSGGDDNSSQRFVGGIMKKIREELEYRVKLCNAHNVKSVDSLPEDVYCPLLLIVLDEYGVIQKHLSYGLGGDDTLDLLLKQGAAFGIRCIFSNQVYEARGLRTDNISIRIGMGKNHPANDTGLYLDAKRAREVITDAGIVLRQFHSVCQTAANEGTEAHYLQHLRFDGDRDVPVILAKEKALLTGWECVHMPARDSRGCRKVPAVSQAFIDKFQVFRNRDLDCGFDANLPIIESAAASMRRRFPDELCLYAGVPCGFDRSRSIHLVRTDRQNILFLCNAAAVHTPSLTADTLLSLCKTAALGRAQAEIWLPESGQDTPLLSRPEAAGIPLYRGESILDRMDALSREITPGCRRLVVLPDLAELLPELDAFLSRGTEFAKMPKPSIPTPGSGGDPFKALMDFCSAVNTASTAPVPPAKAPKPARQKKAAQLLCELLRDGPAKGLHFVIHIRHFSDLRAARDNSGIGLDTRLSAFLNLSSFEHFISATLSTGDQSSADLMMRSGKARSRLEPGLVFYGQETGGIETVYMPYRHLKLSDDYFDPMADL